MLIDLDHADGFDLATQVTARGGTRFSTAGMVEKQAGPGTVLILLPGNIYGDLVIDQGPAHAVPVASTPMPAIGTGVIGTLAVSADDTNDLWIEPSDPATLFDLGAIGAWLRIGGADYRILDQSPDRRQVLLESAAAAVSVGEAYEGVYKFDRMTLRGEVTLELFDLDEAAVYDIGAEAQVLRPGG